MALEDLLDEVTLAFPCEVESNLIVAWILVRRRIRVVLSHVGA
jgi:hypothetical protein